MRRGEIWLVSFDPSVGHEIKKTRPAVVVQNDLGNRFGKTTIVVPITAKEPEHAYPFQAFIPPGQTGLGHASKAKCDQVRVVDRQRLHKRLGVVDMHTLHAIDNALRVALALD